MATKRQLIDSLRDKLRERNADSNYSNRFLYNSLIEQAKWLIKREIAAGRIYTNSYFFQTLKCQDVIETSPVDECCPVKVNCKIYRTKCRLPEMWVDNNGPIIKNVTSVDNSTFFRLVSFNNWSSKKNDPYDKYSGNIYTFYADGYLWFPEKNPHKVNITAFFTDDVSGKNGCSDERDDCVKYLDTRFPVPDWVEAEMIAKAVQMLAGVSKKIQEDEQIDKNSTRKI